MTISKNGFQTFHTNKIILGDGKTVSLSVNFVSACWHVSAEGQHKYGTNSNEHM